MKTSIEWLSEYADIDVSAKELADILTMTGSKVETIESKGGDIKNVVVGKILEIQKHPDADKLVVTKVDVKDEILQIVTGAKNINVGDIIPIAKDGSELPGGVKIKKGALRGVDSCGMMCSIGELGLDISSYPDQIEDGIMILSKDLESRLGEDIVDVLELREDILDFEITPNRPDCLSIEGLGRETAISLGKEFKNPRKNLDELNVQNKEEIEGLRVDIADPDLCYRYIARVVKNVKIAPSPKWLVRRLNACGVRAINNIVDITNYVMLELGEPMHAFDINSIEGKHITVRRAKKNEKITTLDEQVRDLDEDMLVISDDKKAVAIAGVMGGLNSEIENNTETVVFEAAVFNGVSVRNTAKKVGLRTESSSRFEKGLSAENALRAINRAVELVELLNAGKPVDGKIDVYPTKQKQNEIEINPERINALLGIEVSKDEMVEIFNKLGIRVEGNKAIAPYFRQDIEQMPDLAEEVLRFYGYDKLNSTLVDAETTVGGRNKKQNIEDNIKSSLVENGLSEIYTYGFINKEELAKINLSPEDELYKQTIEIKNPLSSDYDIMRTTTLPSMLQTIATNINKKNEKVKLFDISRTYRNKNNQIENNVLPEEETILTIGMYGEDVDFYYLKGIIENVLEVAGVQRYDVLKEKENSMYHPGRCAKLKVGADVFAVFGEVHPLILNNYGISNRIYIAEINMEKVTRYARIAKKYVEVPKYPAVERDIAMVVDEEIEVGQIERIIEKRAKKIIESIQLFDVYRSEKIGENKKSVAYALKFRVPDRTLTDEEVNTVMNAIIEDLQKQIGAELRK